MYKYVHEKFYLEPNYTCIRKHNYYVYILTSLYNVQLFITLIQVKVKFLL